MSKIINLHDKLTGMFIGLAVGDMLGAPLEFIDEVDIKPISGPISGGKHNLSEGYWTDDTSMALCIADSLITYQGYNSYDIMNRFWLWRSQGYRSSTGVCFDIGNQVSESINTYIMNGGYLKVDQLRTENAGNGAIMRLAPIIMAAFEQRDDAEIIRMARFSARETHYSTEAEIATEVFTTLILRALKTNKKSDVLEWRKPSRFVMYDDEFELDGVKPPKFTFRKTNNEVMGAIDFKKSDLNTSGYIIHSLQVAIWAFNNFETFEQGILAVANLGGDSDTNCAIYGQLAGSFYGYKAIPLGWRKILHKEKELFEISEKLISLPSCPILITRFEEDYINKD